MQRSAGSRQRNCFCFLSEGKSAEVSLARRCSLKMKRRNNDMSNGWETTPGEAAAADADAKDGTKLW